MSFYQTTDSFIVLRKLVELKLQLCTKKIISDKLRIATSHNDRCGSEKLNPKCTIPEDDFAKEKRK